MVKTSDLSGAALDYAVAMCEGHTSITRPLYMKGVRLPESEYLYSPSTDWNQGGPIMEKNKIGFDWYRNNWCAFKEPISEDEEKHGDTPLIAAMRCYVWLTLGDEVEIPEEFL